jgi:uncharacterized protein (TIGR03437 family)
MSYDASNVSRQIGAYATTPNGEGGSLWQTGRGLAADGQGNVYGVTGNGDYDGVSNFGESFLKFSGAAPALIDSFTPANWKSMSDNDFDLAAGPALVTGGLVAGSDKLGNLYLLNAAKMSQGATTFLVGQYSIFNFAVWNRTGGAYLYVQMEQAPPTCFQVAGNTLNTTPVSTAANSVTYGRIGMAVSANGVQDGSGILWETTGNYSDATLPGALHAFDASNLAHEVWNSDMVGSRDAMSPVAKFANPTVANGKVYVPTFGNAVVAYGLLPAAQLLNLPAGAPAIAGAVNAASYSGAAVAPGEAVAVFGSNLGPVNPAGTQLGADGRVASNVAGVQVLFDGLAAPLLFASASQVNVIAPFGISAAVTQVQVVYQGQGSALFPMPVAPAMPGIFSATASGAGQAIAQNQDGSLNSPTNPAPAGSVITLWATGAGLLTPSGQDGAVAAAGNLPAPALPVVATVGGNSATVLYAGSGAGMVEGIIQLNVRLPAGTPAAPAVPLAIAIGGSTSQSGLTVAVGP